MKANAALLFKISELNRRMPNGAHGGVRGGFISAYSIITANRRDINPI